MDGIMKIKRNNGVTLLELLIAMTLIILVMSLGSGVFLSFNNIAEGTITSSQAQRNAQIALMHIQKNICNAAGSFVIDGNVSNNSGNSVEYRMYAPDASDIYLEPNIVCRYEFYNGEIRFYPGNILVSNHISNCIFRKVQTDGVVLHIEITALNSNNDPNSAYTVDTRVEATAAASPAVF